MPKPSWHAVDLVSLKPNRKTAHKTAQINSDGRASCMTAQPRRWPPHHTHINIKTTKHIKITISGTTVTIGTVTLVTLVLHTRHHPWWVLVHLVHFVTCDVWYTGWYTAAISKQSSFLAHFWHTRIILVILSTFGAGVTFGTTVTFGTVTLVTLKNYGLFSPKTIRSRERKFQVWNFRSLELSFPPVNTARSESSSKCVDLHVWNFHCHVTVKLARRAWTVLSRVVIEYTIIRCV